MGDAVAKCNPVLYGSPHLQGVPVSWVGGSPYFIGGAAYPETCALFHVADVGRPKSAPLPIPACA